MFKNLIFSMVILLTAIGCSNQSVGTDKKLPVEKKKETPLTMNGGRVWINDISGSKGQEITVDIMVDNKLTPIDAFTIHLGYCPELLEFVDCLEGDLNPKWVMFNCNEPERGMIIIGGFSAQTEVETYSKGCLVRLKFNVIGELRPSGNTCNLKLLRALDDLEDFAPKNGVFTLTQVEQKSPEVKKAEQTR